MQLAAKGGSSIRDGDDTEDKEVDVIRVEMTSYVRKYIVFMREVQSKTVFLSVCIFVECVED